MLTLKPLDTLVPINKQIDASVFPVVLINIFIVNLDDVDQLLKAWEHDANWMKKQPGYISAQLHRGIAGSCVFLNYAIWESVEHFRLAFKNPEFISKLGDYPSSAIAQPHLFSRVAVSNICTN